MKTKAELDEALCVAHHEQMDCMVEIESSIDANANFHRLIEVMVFLAFVEFMNYYLYADTLYFDSVFWKKMLSKLHKTP